MNGKLKDFLPAELAISSYQDFVTNHVNIISPDMTDEQAKELYERMKRQIVLKNDEYQVNLDYNYSFGDAVQVCHCSIKRIDKNPIHDWRDLQAIKNKIFGNEYEAVEIYPAQSRLVDSANQYHLWVFVRYLNGSKEIPKFPLGFFERYVSGDNKGNIKQRSF